jgi:type IV secretion system protein VirB9
MRRLLITMLLLAGLAGPLPAQMTQLRAEDTAGLASSSRARDPRIRYVDYDASQIVRLTGHTGYQLMIEFEPDDRIETVAVGDSSAWQITPNAAANLLFLKPVSLARPTNLSIVTAKRRYNFELYARSGTAAARSEIIYALRFRYPAATPVAAVTPPPLPPPLSPVPTEQWNRAYTYEGAVSNVPEEMFDDGRATYFRFARGKPAPAIFVLAPGAGESIVNQAQRGEYLVIDQVARQFVLRQGSEVTQLHNDGFRDPPPGSDAPRPRPNPKDRKRKRGVDSERPGFSILGRNGD